MEKISLTLIIILAAYLLFTIFYIVENEISINQEQLKTESYNQGKNDGILETVYKINTDFEVPEILFNNATNQSTIRWIGIMDVCYANRNSICGVQ